MSEKAAFHRFGRYVVFRTLGGGGMGRVDLALDPSLDPPELRVLKTMNTDEPTPDAEARFRREATIAMQLSHDAIARTHALEDIDGELCLVQEFVEGVDLSLVQRQSAPDRLPVSTACFVASEVARALAHAHGKGVIHRDVTPNNVMVSYQGAVKLIDFGIAKSVADPKLTQLGVIVGRVIFSPPEVRAGNPADQRADVYALGVVLWEMLVGRKMMDAVKGDEPIPDPCSLVPVPADLGTVVLKALAPDPADRFQTAHELGASLSAFYANEGSARTDLVRFVAGHFDVDRDKRYLRDDVEEAKWIVAGPQSSGALPQSSGTLPQPSGALPARRRPPWIAVAACIVGLTGAAGMALALRGHPALPPSPVPAIAPSAEVHVSRPLETAPVASPLPAPPHNLPMPAEHNSEARSARNPPVRKPVEKGAPSTARTSSAPPQADPKELADLLHEANRRWTAGDGDDGLALAREAAHRGAGAPAHVLIGTILMSKHEVTAAEREFAEAVRLDPHDQEAQRLLEFAKRHDGE